MNAFLPYTGCARCLELFRPRLFGNDQRSYDVFRLHCLDRHAREMLVRDPWSVRDGGDETPGLRRIRNWADLLRRELGL